MQLKPRGQGLFPITLMVLMVGLSFWLQHASAPKDNFSDSLMRHDPDYIVENLTVRRFGATGELQSMLASKKMVHYPDDETSLMTEPTVSFFKGARPTSLTAEQGLIAPDAREIVLVGNVRGVRAATATDPAIVFTSSHLTVFPDDEVMRTTAAVTITQGASVVRGVGMEADNKSRVYQLLSQVSSTIEKR